MYLGSWVILKENIVERNHYKGTPNDHDAKAKANVTSTIGGDDTSYMLFQEKGRVLGIRF